jgi:tRNA threonylcarbamoyladenosine biosynthesis protein TsaE
MILNTSSPEDTQRLGEELGKLARPGDVFLLSGELGSGKTCLTQGIAWGLGIEGYATSPSFVVMNQYRGRLPLYHIDLYRLENVAEVMDLGLDDYLYGDGVCVVEWADRAPQAFPAEHLRIKISYLSEAGRRFEFEPGGKRYVELLSQLKERTK